MNKRPNQVIAAARGQVQRLVRRLEETPSGDFNCLIEAESEGAFVGFRLLGSNIPENIARMVRGLLSPNG